MKKIFGVISVFVLLVVVGVIVLNTVNINRIGKSNVYIEVIEPTEIEEEKLPSGDIKEIYWYEQAAFDKEGKAVEIEFFAQKELRKGAYLTLYIGKENKVTSYEEVAWEDIPSDAQTRLEAEETNSQEE